DGDRHRQRRSGPYDVARIDVSGVLASVASALGMASSCGRSRDSLPQGDAQIFSHLSGIADGETMPKIASVPFDHEHAKDFVVNMPLDERRRARQYFVQVHRGIHFLAYLG